MSREKKSGAKKSSQNLLVTGRLDISRNGMGYVIVEGLERDILIKPNDINQAFNGDIVKVQISKTSLAGKRTEGVVTEVVERKQTTFVGNVQVSKNFAFFVAVAEKQIPDFFIPLDKLNGAVNGSRVVVRLVKWERADKKPEGEVVSVLKTTDVNDMAMMELLIDNGFPIGFEEPVMKEAMQLTDAIAAEELTRRKDCRQVLTFTMRRILMTQFPLKPWTTAAMKSAFILPM